jgi:hypothetical protein
MVSTVGSMSDTGDIQLFIVDAIRLLPVKSHILATKIWCDALPPDTTAAIHQNQRPITVTAPDAIVMVVVIVDKRQSNLRAD